ncbi:permease prefix domain 1-containing protein [Actinoplanes sp. NPDC089786]|uniref:permease prefix domain 1-containing protein n=1 Tax=Actinoplanes sp. NPDC089786 TaxID=3155185 RepID=UPI00343B8345
MTAALPHDRGQGLVDTYLDEMFELLAGTGAEGRRLLAETEDHLTEAVAEGRARGLDAEAAERDAINRFGAPAVVVRRLPTTRIVVRLDLRPLLVGAWAFTGTFLTWYGLSGALTWLLSWPWTRLLIATDRFGSTICAIPRPGG